MDAIIDKQEKKQAVLDVANNNDDRVNVSVVKDIFNDKIEEYTEDEFEEFIKELQESGVRIYSDVEDDTDENAPTSFVPSEVNISQKPLNIYNLMERLQYDEIDLAPAFQRRGNLWSDEQQSRLIESLMLNIPIPTFYFDASNEDKWIVIDGLQRLCAIQNYLVGRKNEHDQYVKRAFKGLQYLRDLNGMTYDELPRQYIRRIKETSVIAYAVEKGTPDGVVFNIFQRINTGGLILTEQEIRQALYQGKATVLIQDLANSDAFLKATNRKISPYRMKDREFITRYLAFTELDVKTEYHGNINDFLIKIMKQINQSYEDQHLQTIKKNFQRVMTYCEMIFKEAAFRKISSEGKRGPINKALFELWSLCFYELTDQDLQSIVKNRVAFMDAYQKLMSDPDFLSVLKASDVYSMERRIKKGKGLVNEFI